MPSFEELDILVRHKGGKTIAGIPQLLIYAKADTIVDALQALEKKKQEIKEGLLDAGEFDDIGGAWPMVQRESLSWIREIALFAAKFAIAFGIIIAGLTISAVVAASSFQGVKIGGNRFWASVEKEIHRAAVNDSFTDDKKHQVLSDVKAIVQRWRPFAMELQAVIAEPPKTNAAPN